MNTKVLTDAEKLARDAALKAATVTKPTATPQVAPLPGMTPLGVKPGASEAGKAADTAKSAEPVKVPSTVTPTSEPPKAATAEPVKTEPVRPAMGDAKVLADLTKVEPVKLQGGSQPTTTNPHTAPVTGGVNISAVKKGKRKGKAEPTADNGLTLGLYDLSVWPREYAKYCPTKADIEVCHALQLHGAGSTNAINFAAELGRFANERNVYDIGILCKGTTARNTGDHKMNPIKKGIRARLVQFMTADRQPVPGAKSITTCPDLFGSGRRICYAIMLTQAGVNQVVKAAPGLKIPAYMVPAGVTVPASAKA